MILPNGRKLVNSRFKIPQIGFGVYLSPAPTCVDSCATALRTGYRHIDTAIYYENELSVGRAIKESSVPRSDIFVTSKILSPGKDVDSTYQMIEESIRKLDGEDGYVDLFLIHSPNGGKESRKLMWLALERAKESGKVRDIGVSNYGINHIKEINEIGNIWPPVVNQIELHPWCQQRELVNYCIENSIVVEAYCPLVRNQKHHDKTLNNISRKHNKSTNQILIRFSIQNGWVPLPKSDNPERIISNVDVYGFELDQKDMEQLRSLDQGEMGSIVQVAVNSE
ncbi:Aldo/keto reductase [Massarina eburnea CBS 473.64]|uniref:Aldo/keto reductase n=1 Tax=Massarina eburnea CBS 473.64 TaxID=1395130 RepID=A0A6A6SD22_9PLEO|nr:Aldo/keto reductase [Massarina eburnea CBS 473.64]